MKIRPLLACLATLGIASPFAARPAAAVELIQLNETNWDEAVPQGKEVDCIYGDWALRNDKIVAVIAAAVHGRNANMTVRSVGGALIDLTERNLQSDQLSAYYPLNAQYELEGPIDVGALPASGTELQVIFRGLATDRKSNATVTYTLADGEPWLKITTRVANTTGEPLALQLTDSIRADGEFDFGLVEDLGLLWAHDSYWRQAYGTLLADRAWHFAPGKLARGEKPEMRIEQATPAAPLAAGQSLEHVRYLFPAADGLEVRALARDLRGEKSVTTTVHVNDSAGPVADAVVEVRSTDDKPLGSGRTGENGDLPLRLPAGKYSVVATAVGRGSKTVALEAKDGARLDVELATPGYAVAKITGEDGGKIPCKVQFIGREGTPNPNYGPDSAIHGVRNVYYTENGQFRVPLTPGKYDVIVSYGPEYDAIFTTLSVEAGKDAPLTASLKRTVDTTGWLSSDFHSHSTPSGDNTASQPGRVLNLLAEHIEFAPCTEHNRITVYDPHLKAFDAVKLMLTCPGMEMTGRPLPINHQNAFPLTPKPRTQDGGAPLPDVDPVVQIERLAMWQDSSDKLVQINHPNLVQMMGDRDLDGSPDPGFERMFGYVDVIEVHPLPPIFTKPDKLPNEREQGNPIFHWLQMMNLGYRVPGVVNTDAHWNFHGSGGLRNYIKSSTDVPTEASVANLVHACEHGNITLTNGPFMTVTGKADQGDDTALVGEDLNAPEGKLHLAIKVQCPNWLEVNRVQLFVNGVPDPRWNYTRRSHPAKFHQGTVVFDDNIPIVLGADAHLVVVAAGEGKQLGPVVGPDQAKEMPTAVSNPIFVDIDGAGFKPNGDLLGLPLPLGPDFKPSKPHKHDHHH